MQIKGKTVLITGGASGIGLEAAKQFRQQGARVIVTGRNKTKLDAVKRSYPDMTVFQSDVSNESDAKRLFEEIEQIGGIDILYNNAGVGVSPLNLGVANDKHLEGAVYEMEVNYFGVIRLNNLFMKMLNSRHESAIINTTSLLCMVPSVLEATYSASKAALSSYTKTLRAHLQAIGSSVKVYELLPPLVDTDMVADRPDKKISPEKLAKALIEGLKKELLTIRVGDSKAVYLINRLFPKVAFGLVNPKKSYQVLVS
ncbi:SDR family NAD(P)-dependent oxidoreductase [Mucilaginibacter gossypii]|uniref:SDR family oxidoreductase n=1 Tax=Mucilaginibacter gossypii TaxID=551996 RepID=UPI000DCD24E4|nr:MULTISPECIES: SDR family NAD(P)-dependent oxidoreductase [Mucilaginibacter]QTE39794.1 SDR family NAD(P)-dependent oxidoreductase [Mucilaginibacter gossypii]RAV54172.1 short-chain dehydrogenase [Mucilaginibacter rubeus]